MTGQQGTKKPKETVEQARLRREFRGLLTDSIAFAAYAHEKQSDRQKVPYILHPLRVMQMAYPLGPMHALVAILHDVVEDCPVEIQQDRLYHTISCQPLVLPREVLDAIDAISQRPGEHYQAYLNRCCWDPIAFQVKLLDIMDNSARLDGLDDQTRLRLAERYAVGLLYLVSCIAEIRGREQSPNPSTQEPPSGQI